jgi:hypothetical protein
MQNEGRISHDLRSSFCKPHSSFCISERVTNGTRTRDVRHHKPALYQLSYGHHLRNTFYRNQRGSQYMMNMPKMSPTMTDDAGIPSPAVNDLS